jgi:hypothetical protein
MTEFQSVAWERPLSAQVAGRLEEVERVEVATRRTVAPESTTPLPALEDMPGVLDVDHETGVVRTLEDGCVSVSRYLGRNGLRALGNRD